MPIARSRRRRRFVAVAALAVAAAAWVGPSSAVRAEDKPTTAPTAERVDNPLYKAWANSKPGSTTTLGLDADSPMGKVHVDMVFTLDGVDKDGATVEVTGTVTMGGQAHAGEPKKQTIPAKVSADDVKATGDKDVDAMGKTFKTKVYEVHPAAMGTMPPAAAGANARKQTATLYLSDDVPGGIVKLEATGGIAGKAGKTQTATVTSFEAK